MAATDNLMIAIRQANKRGDDATVRDLVDATAFYDATFRKLAGEDPKSIAYNIHVAVDQAVVAQAASSPTTFEMIRCRSGCSACCKTEVAIWRHEATLLVEYAAEAGVPIDTDRLKRQIGRNSKTWPGLAPEDRACVFLSPEEGTCRVYEHRPLSCRKHFVVTDPDLCDTEKNPGGIVGRWVSLRAETMQAGALTAYPSGNMAEMLLGALR